MYLIIYWETESLHAGESQINHENTRGNRPNNCECRVDVGGEELIKPWFK